MVNVVMQVQRLKLVGSRGPSTSNGFALDSEQVDLWGPHFSRGFHIATTVRGPWLVNSTSSAKIRRWTMVSGPTGLPLFLGAREDGDDEDESTGLVEGLWSSVG